MKQSTVLKVTTKSGAKISVHCMNEYAAQQELVNMIKDGTEVESYKVSREAELGEPEGQVLKCSSEPYSKVK